MDASEEGRGGGVATGLQLVLVINAHWPDVPYSTIKRAFVENTRQERMGRRLPDCEN